jgi:hypothetical protein
MDAKQFINDLMDLMKQYDLIKEGYSLRGSSDAEIEAMMKAQGISYLPPILTEFLRAMGDGMGGYIFRGADVGCSAMTRIKEHYQYWHADDPDAYENVVFEPTDICVIMSHQSYMYWYFHTDPPDEDPPIFNATDPHLEPVIVDEHLSEFLLRQVEYSGRLHAPYRKDT